MFKRLDTWNFTSPLSWNVNFIWSLIFLAGVLMLSILVFLAHHFYFFDFIDVRLLDIQLELLQLLRIKTHFLIILAKELIWELLKIERIRRLFFRLLLLLAQHFFPLVFKSLLFSFHRVDCHAISQPPWIIPHCLELARCKRSLL